VEQARADEAGRRRAQAAERARELASLRSRLAAGETVTPDDVERALRRAQQSRALADQAHEHAADAHHRAALAHMAAADLLDLLSDRDSALRASVHRDAARADFEHELDDRDGLPDAVPGARSGGGDPRTVLNAAQEAWAPLHDTLGRDPTNEQGA
jgi:hypothetical protein